jgi:hypothetical protein
MFLATIRFRGFGHDRRGGVAVLDVSGSGTDYTGCCTGLQSESGTQCRQCRYQHRDDDLKKLSFTHTSSFLVF